MTGLNADDAALLRELARRFPGGEPFDEANVRFGTLGHPGLLAALRRKGIGLKPLKTGPSRGYLRRDDETKILAWIKRADGQPHDGLVLERGPRGWCRIRVISLAEGEGNGR